MGVGKPAWSGWGQVGDDPAWRCASAHHPRATPHHRSVGSLLQAAPNSGHAGKAHRSDPLPPSTCRALWSTDPAIENGRCPHRWVLKARRLGGSEARRLLNLEARMVSCRRTPRRGRRPHVVTARREGRCSADGSTLRAELGTEHATVQRVSPGCVGRNCLPCHRPAHLTRRRGHRRCIPAPPGAW